MPPATIVPDDWTQVSLNFVGSVVTGSTPPTSDRSNYGQEFLFVSPADLGTAKYIVKSGKMLSHKGFALSRRIPAGSILFVCIGSTIGKVGIASTDLATNQQINSIIPGVHVDPEYLYYAATTLSVRVREQAGEQAVPLVNKSEFSKFQIPLPPMAEQCRIAGALADADSLILTLERLIVKKQAIKHGMMQELLTGRTRLPGFTEPWTPRKVADLIDGLQAGVSVRSVSGNTSGPAVLKTSCIDRGAFVPTESKSILPIDVSRACCNPLAGSIIISRMNTPILVGDVGYVSDTRLDLYLPDRLWLACARTGTATDMRWLAYYFAFERGARALRGLATGTSGSMKNIPKDRVLSLEINVPSDAEQKAIADALSSIDGELRMLKVRLRKAQEIGTGMMQELLSGRIRLPMEAAS